MYLTKRKLTPEKMDHPQVDPGELRAALDHLEGVNRRLLGHRAALRPFLRWSRDWPTDRPIRVLDLGTGSADFPRALLDFAAARGFTVHITAVDLHPETLAVARDKCAGIESIEFIEADARTLTERFGGGSFDYAYAGLFLHHLEDIEVVTVLRIMDRLSSRGMVWNDLIRSPLTKVAIWPLALTGPPIFRHDAVVSMHAGFTKREARDLARRAGWERLRYHNHWLHRFILTAEKSS